MTLQSGQSLSRSAVDNIEIISEGFQRGESKRAIQARLRNQTGKGIRDIDLLAALRFLRGEENIQFPKDAQGEPNRQEKFINLRKSPDPIRARPSKGPILRAFSYTVGIVNTETGEVFGGVQVSSSERLTVNEIKSNATASIGATGVDHYSDVDDPPDDWKLEIMDSMFASETIL